MQSKQSNISGENKPRDFSRDILYAGNLAMFTMYLYCTVSLTTAEPDSQTQSNLATAAAVSVGLMLLTNMSALAIHAFRERPQLRDCTLGMCMLVLAGVGLPMAMLAGVIYGMSKEPGTQILATTVGNLASAADIVTFIVWVSSWRASLSTGEDQALLAINEWDIESASDADDANSSGSPSLNQDRKNTSNTDSNKTGGHGFSYQSFASMGKRVPTTFTSTPEDPQTLTTTSANLSSYGSTAC